MVDRETLDEAISTYNEYRSPMATATLTEHVDPTFTVRFEGPFCRTCCDYDYFEDLVYELAPLGEDPDTIAISDIEYVGDEAFVVEFTAAR